MRPLPRDHCLERGLEQAEKEGAAHRETVVRARLRRMGLQGQYSLGVQR